MRVLEKVGYQLEGRMRQSANKDSQVRGVNYFCRQI